MRINDDNYVKQMKLRNQKALVYQNVYFVDCNSMDDCNLLLSVPRKGGEAKTICELNNIASVDKLKANTLLYKDKLYIPDEGLINLK